MSAPSRLILPLLIAACAATDHDDTAPRSDTGGDDSAAPTDEDLFRLAISGARDPAEALAEIALSDGLPVQTAAGTFLFGCLCGEGSWQLAGDHDDWQGAAMTDAGQGLSWIEAELPSPDGSRYKFADASGTSWRADPLARRYGYDEFGEHSIVRATAAHLERWPGVTDGLLAPRDLHVWVPDGAFTHLLLAHDGQNLFDPEASWGGWRLQDSLPPGMLAVGIANTADRMEEYTHTADVIHGTTYGGRADDYLDMIEEVVRPMVAGAYGEAEVVGIMGSSLGGLVSVYAAQRAPGAYDMAISLSGTVGWGSIGGAVSGETVIERFVGAGRGGTALFIDSGGQGSCQDGDGDGVMDDAPDGRDNYCENIQLRDVLSGEGYIFGDDLWHWHEPGAPHNEAAWADRVERPLLAFAELE